MGLVRKCFVGGVAALLAIVGGGFASAAGNEPAGASHQVTYTILSYRAISLGGSDPHTVDFGNVRQGHIAFERGPLLRYATTWAGDSIRVFISRGLTKYAAGGVKLKLFAYGNRASGNAWNQNKGPQRPSDLLLAGDSNGAGICDGWDAARLTSVNTPEGFANDTLVLGSKAIGPTFPGPTVLGGGALFGSGGYFSGPGAFFGSGLEFVTGITDCGISGTLGGWVTLQTNFAVDARAASGDFDFTDPVRGTVGYVIDFGI